MCNLYRMKSGEAEVAALFGARPSVGVNLAEEVYPGYPGLVVVEGTVHSMTWGFPLVMRGKKGNLLKPKAVTNAREDKLKTAFWRDSFVHRRCLVPVTQWAEAEGQAGKMTRTWYGMPGGALFAVAGIWRATAEWADAYSMVMVDSCPSMVEVHDRMPVILHRENWAQWIGGATDEAFALCRTWDGTLDVERTAVPWAARASSARAGPALL